MFKFHCISSFRFVWVRSAAVMLLLSLALSSCCRKIYPSVSDSTRVEYRDRLVHIHDTATVELEKIVERTVVRTGESHLENKYAKSDASVDEHGDLHHTLESIPQTIRVPYETVVEVHDTLIVHDHAETVVEYKEKELRKSQLFFMSVGKGIVIAMILLTIACLIIPFVRKD